MNKSEIAKTFDHTYLKAMATEEILHTLCQEAKQIQCASVAVNQAWISYCKTQLKDSSVSVCGVVAFPLGQTGLKVKEFEVRQALMDGADEVDYVLDVGRVKMHDWDYVQNEMQILTDIAHQQNKHIKVIFETCYLTKEEIIECSKIASIVQPDFIKTSTGFGTGGATVEDVKLMVQYSGENVKVKASGGIRDWPTCKAMLEAGATRIGTSSSLQILDQIQE